MNTNLQAIISKLLERRSAENRLRVLPDFIPSAIDLCSNDYLSLSYSGALTEALKESLTAYDAQLCGATGSRLISGNLDLICEFEANLASFHQAGSATVFSSGYDANLGVISALGNDRGITFVYDELIHASMRDAFRLSYAKSVKFPHNDCNALKKILLNSKGIPIVCVESVYSMDGDRAPLVEIAEICSQAGAPLIVDEAHSTGVFGNGGRGLVEELNLTESVQIRVHTWGKALGCQGAVVVGPSELQPLLTNYARSFIYSTGLAVPIILTARAAYELIEKSEEKREALLAIIEAFPRAFQSLAFPVSANPSPIQSVIIPGPARVRSIALQLREQGINCMAILSPTVPAGTERLRISLHSHNTIEDLTLAASQLSELLR